MSLLSRDQLTAEILLRCRRAAAHRRTEHLAARLLQATWRGYAARQRIRRLHRLATVIQRCYRGHRDRRHYHRLLEDALQHRVAGYFDHHATTIQRTWRGHRSRSTIFDYRKLRRWLRQVADRSAQLEDETWAYFFDERKRAADEQNAVARKLCVLIARKLHHLLRTHQRPGIYSRSAAAKPDASALTQVEQLLAAFRFRGFNRHLRAERCAGQQEYLQRRAVKYAGCPGGRQRRCDEHYRVRDVDAMEAEWAQRQQRELVAIRPKLVGVFEGVQPVQESAYQRGLMATERYCDNIMAMSREFEILAPGRDFCLNTRIMQRPERIEQFVAMLREYCVTHNLIEK